MRGDKPSLSLESMYYLPSRNSAVSLSVANRRVFELSMNMCMGHERRQAFSLYSAVSLWVANRRVFDLFMYMYGT